MIYFFNIPPEVKRPVHGGRKYRVQILSDYSMWRQTNHYPKLNIRATCSASSNVLYLYSTLNRGEKNVTNNDKISGYTTYISLPLWWLLYFKTIYIIEILILPINLDIICILAAKGYSILHVEGSQLHVCILPCINPPIRPVILQYNFPHLV